MSKIPVYNAIRIIPRESDYLDRKSGLRGEIFYDQDNNTLRLYDGDTVGGQSLFKTASDGSIDITAQKNKIRFHWDTLSNPPEPSEDIVITPSESLAVDIPVPPTICNTSPASITT